MLCKWLLIGDSLLAGFKTLPDSVNRAKVGNTPSGVLKALESDLQACRGKPVILSIGTNVLFNNRQIEFNRIVKIIDIIVKDGRKVIIMPIVAKGEYLNKASIYNNFYSNINNIKHLRLHPDIHKYVLKDNIHLSNKGYKIWLNQLNSLY